MTLSHIVAIFNDDFTLGAVLFMEREELVVEMYTGYDRSHLERFLSTVQTEVLTLRREVVNENGERAIVAEVITKDNPRYIVAVSERLKAMGQLAIAVPEVLRPLLEELSKAEVSQEDREKLIPELVHIDSQDAEDLVASLPDIRAQIVSLQKYLEKPDPNLLERVKELREKRSRGAKS